MSVNLFSFGALADGTPVTAARLKNSHGTSVTVLDYGATIQSLVVPDKGGAPIDVVLGYDTASEYERGGCYLGATIGRVGNRVGGARFSLNGETFFLAKNDGENHLHGGERGFDKRMWRMEDQDGSLVCERLSPDGEEGYPGNLSVRVTFTLTESSALRIQYDADADRDTPVSLTNHSYFNLNGGGSALEHRLQINAERFCENDESCLPTGKLLRVEGTPFDFRAEKEIAAEIRAGHIQLRRFGGYDHNYVLSGSHAAFLTGDRSGIRLAVETDLPGMQLYTANALTEQAGKGGKRMGPHGAVCLETQLFPNAMNCWGFPSPVLRAGQHLHSETVFAFLNDSDRKKIYTDT